MTDDEWTQHQIDKVRFHNLAVSGNVPMVQIIWGNKGWMIWCGTGLKCVASSGEWK